MGYLENMRKLAIQDDEYVIPYHYQDVFAPAQSIERNSIFSTIIKKLGVDSSCRILDIGCGDGRFCYYAKNICSIDGIDISERALSWAKVFNPGINFYRETLQSFLCPSLYDGLVCIEVLEHVPEDQIHSLLGKAVAILKPGGKFIITVPSTNVPLHAKHFRHYDKTTLFRTLSPYFNVEIIGHSRKSGLRRVMSLINLVSLMFYSDTFVDKYPRFVRIIFEAKNSFWYKHLHSGDPEDCFRLIAVCTNSK